MCDMKKQLRSNAAVGVDVVAKRVWGGRNRLIIIVPSKFDTRTGGMRDEKHFLCRTGLR